MKSKTDVVADAVIREVKAGGSIGKVILGYTQDRGQLGLNKTLSPSPNILTILLSRVKKQNTDKIQSTCGTTWSDFILFKDKSACFIKNLKYATASNCQELEFRSVSSKT